MTINKNVKPSFYAAVAGLLNGIAFGMVADISLRLLYAFARNPSDLWITFNQSYIDKTFYPFHWAFLPTVAGFLFVGSSMITRRLVGHWFSPLLLSMCIGIVSVSEFFLVNFVWDFWEVMTSDMGLDYCRYGLSNKPTLWLILVPSVLIFQILFAWIQNRIKRHHIGLR
jgi:hypothetical protein